MGVRYCTTRNCRYYGNPLPEGTGACPACGETRLRLNPDGVASTCPECGEVNTHPRESCWNCGAALDYDYRVIG